MAVKDVVSSFRKSFRIGDNQLLRWFPGHMAKGMKDMERKLKSVDCVVEVHDARIPISGRNPNFKHSLLGLKPHILVLNKMDMIDTSLTERIEKRLKRDGISHVLFTDCKKKSDSIKKLIPLALELISSSDRFNRFEEEAYRMMIIGVPNVGKSSIINALRNMHLKKRKAAHVGAVAGITRSVQTEIKVSEVPLMYLLDTPGILTPTVPNVEVGLKLALCSCLQDHLVGEEIIADYLLYYMNQIRNFEYTKFLNLDEPTDNIGKALSSFALSYNVTEKRRSVQGGYVIVPNLTAAAQHFIKAFRNGEFGPLMLDIEEI